MKNTTTRVCILAMVLCLTGAAEAQPPAPAVQPPAPAAPPPVTAAQPPAPAAPRSTAAPAQPADSDPAVAAQDPLPDPEPFPDTRRRAPVFRIGGDYTVRVGERARDITVISGSVTIEGDVEGDVVVILGTTSLGAGAAVRGDLVVIGGDVVAMSGASVVGDLTVVGGMLTSPPDFASRGDQTIVGGIEAGTRLRAVVPWLTRGLLWGRLIVPDLPWVWGVAGVFLLVYLVIGVAFDRPVRACADALAAKPLTTFLFGMLVLLLIGPVSFVLAISVVGIAVLPFLLCALLIAAAVGKAGVLRWIGAGVVSEGESGGRRQGIRSLVIGGLALVLAYMVPVLGVVTWVTLGVFAFGAAAVTSVAGLRRENPAPPAPLPVPVVRPAVTGPALEGASAPADFGGGIGQSAPMTGPDLTTLPRARFLIRFAAFALDFLLVLMCYALLDLDDVGPLFFMLLAYHIAFWSWKGTTIGGIICHLRVVRMDGAPPRIADAVVRGLSSVFSFAVLGLGCLWILKDAERQAWHDKIAGTYVVKVPVSAPLP